LKSHFQVAPRASELSVAYHTHAVAIVERGVVDPRDFSDNPETVMELQDQPDGLFDTVLQNHDLCDVHHQLHTRNDNAGSFGPKLLAHVVFNQTGPHVVIVQAFHQRHLIIARCAAAPPSSPSLHPNSRSRAFFLILRGRLCGLIRLKPGPRARFEVMVCMRKHKLAWMATNNTCTFSEPIQANANVLIPKGTHVVLKESPPSLGTVVVEGVLEVDPSAAFIKMMVSPTPLSPPCCVRCLRDVSDSPMPASEGAELTVVVYRGAGGALDRSQGRRVPGGVGPGAARRCVQPHPGGERDTRRAAGVQPHAGRQAAVRPRRAPRALRVGAHAAVGHAAAAYTHGRVHDPPARRSRLEGELTPY
jgi:hypothetical protein